MGIFVRLENGVYRILIEDSFIAIILLLIEVFCCFRGVFAVL